MSELEPVAEVRIEEPRPAESRDRGRTLATVVVTVLLVAMALMAIASMAGKSATFDEPMYIVGGRIYWTTADARLANRFHPVFAPLWTSLPTLTFDLLPRDDPSFEAVADDVEGYKFCPAYFYLNGARPDAMLFAARLPMVLLGAMLAGAVYAWSASLFGRAAGTLSLVLCVFAPDILAHMRLATTDFAITTFYFLALWFFWRFVRRGEKWSLAPAGVCFGLAMLSKFTAIILLPVMALIALAEAFARPASREDGAIPPRRGLWKLGGFAAALVAIFALALVVIAAGYRFDFTTGGRAVDIVLNPENSKEPLPVSATLSIRTLRILPVPPQYVDTVAWALDKNRDGHPAFMLGRRGTTGWWSYFPLAFALKTTFPFMILLVIGGAMLLARRAREALFLLVPAAGFFGLGMTGQVNIGFRHVLPVMPLLFVACGAMLLPVRSRMLLAALVVLAALLAGWHAFESLSIHPDYLAYFNAFAGGPENGWRRLVDSNLDWGQDVGRIGPRLRKLGITEEVRLAVFGNINPADLDFPHKRILVGAKPRPGVWVVSATELQDVYSTNPERFAWLRDRFKPIDVIGHSIFIYRISEEDIGAMASPAGED